MNVMWKAVADRCDPISVWIGDLATKRLRHSIDDLVACFVFQVVKVYFFDVAIARLMCAQELLQRIRNTAKEELQRDLLVSDLFDEIGK